MDKDKETILAAIALDNELVNEGVPVFLARDKTEQEKLALYLSRILDGAIHDLENGVMIIVRH